MLMADGIGSDRQLELGAPGVSTMSEPQPADITAQTTRGALAGAETMRPLIKPAEMARYLEVSRAWVYRAAEEGRIPSIRLGGPDGPLRFVPDDVEQWLREARARWTPGMRINPAEGTRAESPSLRIV